jgi:chloramphenicol-sensitive protein RarD
VQRDIPTGERAPTRERTQSGLWLAFAAYASWGLLALFWKALSHVPASEQLAHRTLGAALVMLALLFVRGRLGELRPVLRDRARRRRLLLSAALLALNWFVFIYAVTTDRVLHASLGYYLNPIVSVVLGMIVLGERLRRLQWAAVGAALLGVALMIGRAGEFPWIGVVLALAFGFYGLLRKTIAVEPLPGSAFETCVLALPCAAAIAWLELGSGTGHLVRVDTTTTALLLATGVVTAMPLLWFTDAARRLPLFALGFMQYLTPTIQFLLAVLVFQETFTRAHAVAFAMIWTGVALFALDLAITQRRLRQATVLAA